MRIKTPWRFAVAAAMAIAFLAPSQAQSEDAMEVRLCTGGENGPYHQAGQMIQDMASGNGALSVEVVFDTGGTWSNIDRTVRTDPSDPMSCHAMLGQPDGQAYLKRTDAAAAKSLRKVQELHMEYLHVLCSLQSGVDELEDLEDDPKAYSIALGDQGSGAWLVWQNIIAEDEDYAAVPVKAESGALALSGVATDETTCMLVPAGLGNKTVRDADTQYNGQIVLAEAQDKDFNDAEDADGRPLYEWVMIPGDTYEISLQAGWGGAVGTIGWKTGVYVNTEAFAGKDKALNGFIEATSRARSAIIAEFGG